ncbi:hypothetical protein EAI_07141 [Harpegnathos saltator]|uniref:RRM domain-containing protein n=1 Tax=Harpegnathos saltator TaxID=610380 RepID=E2C602_HARSA|nr:hypothetical protein EAI_07141 [Harpegnathos saltator]
MEDESDDEKMILYENKLESENTESQDESAVESSDDENDASSAINDSVKQKKKSNRIEDHSTSKHPRRVFDDVNEGKTVFLKNVPFSVKNNELKEYMEQFGPIYCHK